MVNINHGIIHLTNKPHLFVILDGVKPTFCPSDMFAALKMAFSKGKTHMESPLIGEREISLVENGWFWKADQ